MSNGFTVYEVSLEDACCAALLDGGEGGRSESDTTMYVGTKREAEKQAATARSRVRKYLTQHAAWEGENADFDMDPDEGDEWLEDEPEYPMLGNRLLDTDASVLNQESAIRVYRVQLRTASARSLALHLLDPRTNGWWQHSRILIGSWPLLRGGR